MGVRIAVEGCGHGTLHAIYASVEQSCKMKGWPDVDLLIICGDFQAVRNAYDLNCVAMPAKYREMCDFHEYYSGTRVAPYLTIFVGGNHEASNYLYELYYGGWVAPNIYYMGAANVLNLGPLRISGMSGIWKGYNYKKLHYERLPYNEDDVKSIYHVRELDIRKLLQVSGPVDVGISHDWPRGVEWQGDWKRLFQKKEHLEQDARSGQLGNVAAKQVMDKLRPDLWFSGHLHCKYAAVIDHSKLDSITPSAPGLAAHRARKMDAAKDVLPPVNNEDEIALDLEDAPSDERHGDHVTKTVNDDEIELDLGESEPNAASAAGAPQQELLSGGSILPEPTQSNGSDEIEAHRLQQSQSKPESAPPTSTTRFLALDKCLPGRDFLQLLEVPVTDENGIERPLKLHYDREWLAITKAFAKHEPLLLGEPKFNAPPLKSDVEYRAAIQEERKTIDALPKEAFEIPHDFAVTAPVFDGGDFRERRYTQAAGGLIEYSNPQTTRFCEMLDIPNPFDIPDIERQERMSAGPRPASDRSAFPNGRGRSSHRGYGPGRERGRGRGR